MARHLVQSVFREALREKGDASMVLCVLGIARTVAIDLLIERGISRRRAVRMIDHWTHHLEKMTDQWAKEMGLA